MLHAGENILFGSAMTWYPFNDGHTIGTSGSESGIILLDEEHPTGARITLERGTATAPYAITCGIYGSMMHTVFAVNEHKARATYDAMKVRLEQPLSEELPEADYCRMMEQFVADFQ